MGRLSEEETFQRCTTLGVGSALMILNGYPGETSGEAGTRWCFWFLSMLPFTYIVYTLFVGLKESQESQPEACRDQVKWACWATVFSWCTYQLSTSCQCSRAPPLARWASPLAPWCTALVWLSPWLRRLARAVLRPRLLLVVLASKCTTMTLHKTVDGSSYACLSTY